MSTGTLLAQTISLRTLLKGLLTAALIAVLASAAWWLFVPGCGASCYMMHQRVAIETAQLKMIQIYRRTGKLEKIDSQMEPPRSAHIDHSALTSTGTMVVSSKFARTVLIVEPLPEANGVLKWRCRLWSDDLTEDFWCRGVVAGPAPEAIKALPP